MNLHLQPLQVATDSSDQEWTFGHFEWRSGITPGPSATMASCTAAPTALTRPTR